jgi:hypothetical protein
MIEYRGGRETERDRHSKGMKFDEFLYHLHQGLWKGFTRGPT